MHALKWFIVFICTLGALSTYTTKDMSSTELSMSTSTGDHCMQNGVYHLHTKIISIIITVATHLSSNNISN